MGIDSTDDWFSRAHAIATLIYGDPVWAAQEYAMQRGERTRGDYDPPIPEERIEAIVAQYRVAQARKDAQAVTGSGSVSDGAGSSAASPTEP